MNPSLTSTASPALTAPQVIAAFAFLTGIHFRLLAPDVEHQAIKFVKAGFTLRDLETVILYLKRELAAGRGGYTDSSLRWQRLFGLHGAGDEFQVFQERLGLAQIAIHRGWHPAYKVTASPANTAAAASSAPAASSPQTTGPGTPPAAPSIPPDPEERRRVIAKIAELKHRTLLNQ